MRSGFCATLVITVFSLSVVNGQLIDDRVVPKKGPSAGKDTEKQTSPDPSSRRKPRSDNNEKRPKTPDSPAADEPASALDPENRKMPRLATLSDEELKKLLDFRVVGGMGMTFGQFSNMYLVQSRLNIGVGIGLMADDRKIARTELRSPFPESYHPTMREFLDAVALQTFSEWKYDPTDKHFQSDVELNEPVIVSTIIPQLEDEIFPDVQEMLESFAADE